MRTAKRFLPASQEKGVRSIGISRRKVSVAEGALGRRGWSFLVKVLRAGAGVEKKY